MNGKRTAAACRDFTLVGKLHFFLCLRMYRLREHNPRGACCLRQVQHRAKLSACRVQLDAFQAAPVAQKVQPGLRRDKVEAPLHTILRKYDQHALLLLGPAAQTHRAEQRIQGIHRGRAAQVAAEAQVNLTGIIPRAAVMGLLQPGFAQIQRLKAARGRAVVMRRPLSTSVLRMIFIASRDWKKETKCFSPTKSFMVSTRPGL